METTFRSYYRGVGNYKSGRFKKAIEDFNNELEKYSTHPDIYIYRGRAKYLSGDKNGALQDWVKAAELGDRNVYELIEKHFG
jgi:tetratricopeptide (TPR) repeat protein